MKKSLIIIIISCCGTFVSCNSGDKNTTYTDTTAGANQHAKAAQSSVDTNVNNIGTDRKINTDSTTVKP
ncbi:MAG: hypothetical protein ACOH2A_02085 [Sphingobacteriaceae bacterium]